MRSGGGKAKGSEFERNVCKLLSLWITDDQRDDIFWRSAMSGGRASVKFQKGKDNITQVGDISAIDPIGHKLIDNFVVECKSYNNIKIDSMIYGVPKGDSLLGFWEQLKHISYNARKFPIIIFKQHAKPILIGLDDTGWKKFIYDRMALCPILAWFPVYNLRVFLFTTFLSGVDHASLDILKGSNGN
jgi:hypothetical protein